MTDIKWLEDLSVEHIFVNVLDGLIVKATTVPEESSIITCDTISL